MTAPGNELSATIVDSYEWMTRATRTRDDQDPIHPYKPMPKRPYLKVMHEVWQHEAVLFLLFPESPPERFWVFSFNDFSGEYAFYFFYRNGDNKAIPY
jgi:hypothetical protein